MVDVLFFDQGGTIEPGYGDPHTRILDPGIVEFMTAQKAIGRHLAIATNGVENPMDIERVHPLLDGHFLNKDLPTHIKALYGTERVRAMMVGDFGEMGMLRHSPEIPLVLVRRGWATRPHVGEIVGGFFSSSFKPDDYFDQLMQDGTEISVVGLAEEREEELWNFDEKTVSERIVQIGENPFCMAKSIQGERWIYEMPTAFWRK